jgi:hypothetical protein
MNIPHIAQLARGGVVTRPTPALIGERGPEAVVPLGGGAGVVTMIVNVDLTFSLFSGASRPGGPLVRRGRR